MHNPPHPGESLRDDVLPAMGISVSALAGHLGLTQSQLSAVLNGRASLCATLAYRLQLAGLGDARQYLAEQMAYDLWQVARQEHPPITRLTLP
ncbi:putative HTH-type transcriptional regulator [Pseudomonas reidholzensis]|uniref:Putative HTH-type transcriptional regulator n=1 Tax=Pseudomonas reidholzensis TaxID=1785162 RepID=A0A383RLT4_9PSED|nr:HigA family addiction module antitoxin [Pseudomonas reidholzensis]SYX88057.1 putative HTH-type transcriptional regulator [Pseudomonas reidholzensis]